MSLGILIREAMQGWIELKGERHPFTIQLEAFTRQWWSLTAPRPFQGTVSLGSDIPLPTEGILTIFPSGPHYEIRFYHPDYGWLDLSGKKTYALSELHHSLTTCPLTVFQNKIAIGQAELSYRKPIWQFPLESLRLARRPTPVGDQAL